MANVDGSDSGWPDSVLLAFEQIGYYADGLDPMILAHFCSSLGAAGLGQSISWKQESDLPLGEAKDGVVDLG